MSARHVVALVVLVVGVALLLLAAIAVLALPGVHPRLHAAAPGAVLGVPLLTLALAVETGPGRAALKLLLIGVASAAGGTVTTMALGRAARRGTGVDAGGGAVNDTIVVAALILVAVGGTAAVLARDPARQAVALGMQGLLLAVLFTVLQAPDVALSQLVVGTALTPLLILLTVRKIRTQRTVRQAVERARADGADDWADDGAGDGFDQDRS